MSDNDAEKVSRTDCTPWRDEETVRYFYHGKGYSLLETAEAVGCTEGTVSQWCDRLDIETRDAQEARDTGTPPELKDSGWLRREYRENERTCADIAGEVDVTDLTVSRWLRRHDIPTRPAHGLGNEDIDIECAECGVTFTVSKGRADSAKYCSRGCYYDGLDMPTGDDHWSYNSVDIECDGCGERFTVPRSQETERRYCSRECFQSDYDWPVGDDHPGYRGEDRTRRDPINYGPGWNQEKRKTVRERDGKECTECGLSQADHLHRYSCKLNVHHLVDPREATQPAVYNAARNLTSLCLSCHSRVERLGVDIGRGR